MDKRIIAAFVVLVGTVSVVLYSNGMWAGLLVTGMLVAYLVVGLGTRFALDGRSSNVVKIMAAISTLLILGVVGAMEGRHFPMETLLRQYGAAGAVLGGASFGALAGFWWGGVKAWMDYRNKLAASS